MPIIHLNYLQHRGKEWISIEAEKDDKINRHLKKIKARWTKTYECWLLPYSNESILLLKNTFQEIAELDWTELKKELSTRKQNKSIGNNAGVNNKTTKTTGIPSGLSPENTEAMRRFLETLRLKSYSESTIRTYRNEFLQLLLLLKNKPVASLTTDELKRYLQYCMEKEGLKENSVHSRINALKFYYEQVENQPQLFLDIPRPKKPFQLPRFFNQTEIAAIIKAVGNLKHRVMLMLAYSAGMRVSEVVSIKTRNIDSKRMCILIERAKGKKDRMVALSPVLLVMLREYWKQFKPKKEGYLFEGQYEGKPYSSRSLQFVIDRAKKKAGILKPGSIHALRHSFATHLLDKGTDVTMIMKLLGHNDIKTTLRYLHVTNRDMLQVFSPLDDLDLGL